MNLKEIINFPTKTGHHNKTPIKKGVIIIKTCIYCKKELTKIQIGKKNKFCSKNCEFSYKKDEHQKYEPNFFLIENKHTLYYLLGLLFTDGNLDNAEKRITLSLTNKEIIQFLYPYFSSNLKKIYEYKPKLENANITYTILNENSDAITELKNMGFTPHNSITKNFPDIPNKYLGDFIRGVFDGDGCVYISTRTKKKNYLAISITAASESFIFSLKSILEEKGFHPTIVLDSRRRECEIKTYYLKLNRQKEIQKFYKLIYENATIRNYNKYRKFCYENIV